MLEGSPQCCSACSAGERTVSEGSPQCCDVGRHGVGARPRMSYRDCILFCWRWLRSVSGLFRFGVGLGQLCVMAGSDPICVMASSDLGQGWFRSVSVLSGVGSGYVSFVLGLADLCQGCL